MFSGNLCCTSGRKRQYGKHLEWRMRPNPGLAPQGSAHRSSENRCMKTARTESPRQRPHHVCAHTLSAPLVLGSRHQPQPGPLHRKASLAPLRPLLGPSLSHWLRLWSLKSHPSSRSSFQPVSLIMNLCNPVFQTGLPLLFHLVNCRTHFQHFHRDFT